MQASKISYAETGKFSEFILNYLDQKPPVAGFFGNWPTLAGFEKQLELKADFAQQKREVLAAQLAKQYAHLRLQGAEADLVAAQLNLLKNKNTFTVTTGHQLCLFTGPLYTVYKIIHTIKLAEELAKTFPDKNFVPLFWMATEDHDFEEVNHIYLHGHKLEWHTEPGNAVGRLDTSGIARVIDDLQKLLPAGERVAKLLSTLRDCYTKNENLADATRALVHNWFGHKGLICVDGDDAELKKTMIPAFKRELLEELSYRTVTETNQKLAEHTKIQVTPRPINLFYLHNNLRSRLVRNGANFSALNTNLNFTEAEILTELENFPDRFSPNVLLRPLYQGSILPNLAYIGGGGEVAYWAEMKEMFAAFQVPFPIVLLRQSVQLVPKKLARKQEKLGFTTQQLFGKYHNLANILVKRNCDYEAELLPTRERLEELFGEVKKLAKKTDVTLITTVEAQKSQALKRLLQLEKKLVRAAKRKDDDGLRMLQEWQNEMLPGGGLQERHDNILQHLVQFGDDLWESVFAAVEPLDFQFIVLTEE